MPTPSVHIAVLVVATDPAKADLATAMIIRGRAANAGHQIVQQTVTKDMEAGVRSQLARWIDDRNIDLILVTGNVESDAVAAAIKPLVTEKLQGFTDLFRYLAFQELGAGAMLSNAEAAQCNTTYLFVLPGSAGAVGTAMDKLILPQLDPNTKPKNLVSSMPRLHQDAVPSTIISEKTTGGTGLDPKMPAPRAKAPTGRNVVRRAEADPPTRLVDVGQLERLANQNDAQTKPNIELRKMLPSVPPGADDTETDLLAAPPAERATEKRAETSPAIPPPPAIPQPGPPRPKTTTAQRVPRPITVPPTSAFAKGEGTSPGTLPPVRRPPAGSAPPPPVVTIPKKESTEHGAVMPSRKPADSGKQNTISSGVPTTPATKRETGRVVVPPPVPAKDKSGPTTVPAKPVSSAMLTPAASSVFSEAAKTEPAPAKSSTPSVEMAPLLDAQELSEEPDVKPPPARPRAPTPPPPVVAPRTDDVESKPTVPARPRAPTPPPPVVAPRDSAVDLPVGTFNYPTKQARKIKPGTIIALLLAAGIGFAAVVFVVPRFTEHKPTQTAQVQPPAPPAPAPVVEAPAPEVQPPAPEPPPPPVAEPPTPPAPTPEPKPVTRPSTPKAPQTAVTKPDLTPTETPPVETKPEPTPAPADDGCDEVGCVLSKYDRPCCERYKPQSSDLKPRTGGIPQELDRAMVRTGVEAVKPAIVACGEKAGVKGTVKVAVEVAPEGNVTSAEVSESPDPALGTCVATAMKKAKFGKSVNGGSFSYPFAF